MQTGPPLEHALIRNMYEAYNACDLPRLAAFMSRDVDWPDGAARLHGLQAVEDYWSRLWARAHVHDEVVGVADVGPARTAVRISQVVRDLDGKVVSTGAFEHTYTFRDGLVLRMDLRELQSETREQDDE